MSKIKTKPYRSVVKAFTWRVIATLTTTTIVFFATGSITLSLGVGFFDIVIKLVLYYFHERVWDRSNLGIHKNIDAS